jgi:hypothetical protein
MPLAHWNGLTLFFAHVPKTGGSSVEDYLIRRFGPLSILDINKRQGVTGTGLIVPATHLAAIDVAEFLPHNLTYSFTMVRDPVTRLMSEYRYQKNVSRMSRLGFSTWLRIMIHAVRAEPRLYENHIRPQSDLVPEGADIFRLEDGFDDMIAKLDKITDSSAPDITVGHLNIRKRAEITLSQQDVALISEFYAPDYERFGYARPDTAHLKPDPKALWRDSLARVLVSALVRKQRYDWAR